MFVSGGDFSTPSNSPSRLPHRFMKPTRLPNPRPENPGVERMSHHQSQAPNLRVFMELKWFQGYISTESGWTFVVCEVLDWSKYTHICKLYIYISYVHTKIAYMYIIHVNILVYMCNPCIYLFGMIPCLVGLNKHPLLQETFGKVYWT